MQTAKKRRCINETPDVAQVFKILYERLKNESTTYTLEDSDVTPFIFSVPFVCKASYAVFRSIGNWEFLRDVRNLPRSNNRLTCFLVERWPLALVRTRISFQDLTIQRLTK